MDLLTAPQLAAHFGVTYASLKKHIKAGTIPSVPHEGKRQKFHVASMTPIIEELKASGALKLEVHTDKAEVETEAPNPEIAIIVGKALARARRSFQAAIKERMSEDMETGAELAVLRLYAKSDEVFDAVRAELLS